MGRKIPGKKHRGVKNPYTQKRKRDQLKSNVINNPPVNEDEQEIPKSLVRIMKLKEMAKTKQTKKRQRKTRSNKNMFDVSKAFPKEVEQHGMNRPDRYVPAPPQHPNERLDRYVKRVSRTCDNFVKEKDFEQKFGVEVKRDLITGDLLGVVKDKREKKRSKKKGLSEKRKERQLKKEAARQEEEPEKDFPQSEVIPFGEVVHQPPTNLPENLINKRIKIRTSHGSTILHPGDLSILEERDRARRWRTLVQTLHEIDEAYKKKEKPFS